MTTFLTSTRERDRFFRFAVVGVIGAIVDFGVMNLLVQVFHTHLVFAGTVSFVAAIISNFTWNRFWTYPDSRSKSLSSQLVQFTIVSVAGLVIRIPLLALVEPIMQNMFEVFVKSNLANLLAKNATLAVAVGIVMFWNFFINRFWTYNDVE